MAVRFDASADKVSRTTNLPPITSFTMMCWVAVKVDRNAYSCFLHAGALSDDKYFMGTDNSGLTLNLFSGDDNTGTALVLNTWYHIAMTVSGTGAGAFLGYLNGALNITAPGAVITIANIAVGQDGQGEWSSAAYAALKVYSAVLTASEIQQEMRCMLPVRTANLNTWSPLLTHTDVANYAGTGAWTVGGTLTTEVGPPIPWSVRPTRWLPPAGLVTPPTGGLLPAMMHHAA